IHTHILSHRQIHTHTLLHKHTLSHRQIHTHSHRQIHTHTVSHRQIHTHTHTHTHTLWWPLFFIAWSIPAGVLNNQVVLHTNTLIGHLTGTRPGLGKDPSRSHHSALVI